MKYLLLFITTLFMALPVKGQENSSRMIVQLTGDDIELIRADIRRLMEREGIQIKKFSRLFPYVQPPDQILFRKFPFVPPFDLSKMYELELDESDRADLAWKLLQNFEGVRYAEIPGETTPLSLPNDPQADSISGSQKAVLKQIKAYAAWLQAQGDTNTVVGILDTGTKWDHEDLISNIAYNLNDPINGIDDDGNGLIDDYAGWDFGNSDNNPLPDVANVQGGHGTSVASIASMQANNAIGGTGSGYNCRFVPIKIWNYNGSSFSNFRGYEAIVYAAHRGCKVINCSWGSNRIQLQYERDIINFATFQKNALIVAAGGNSFSEANFVPATTDHVLGVAFCDTLDRISVASTFSYDLDIAAPGTGVYGIQAGGSTYGFTDGGSSMAAPVVAGAAALLRSKFPELHAIQIAALLKANADVIDTLPMNIGRRYKTGDGRLNMAKAIQKVRPFYFELLRPRVRALRGGDQLQSGDTISLFADFLNVLNAQTNVTVTLRCLDSFVSVLDSVVAFQDFAELQTKTNPQPFRFAVSSAAPNLSSITLQFLWQSNQNRQIRHLRMNVTNDWVALDTNRINISIFANGRLGFNQLNYTNGRGTRYHGANMASDAGLMIGISPQKVSNCVFSQNGRSDHFKPMIRARFVPHPALDEHILSYFNDSLAGIASIGIQVKQSSYAVASDSLQKVIFLQYELNNRSGANIDSAFVGVYHDWDIGNFNANKANFDSTTSCGYSFETGGKGRHAGVVQLTLHPSGFYAIDALPNTNNNNINLFDGFSISEKWQTLSNLNLRREAGMNTPGGNNVVQVYSTKVNQWANGEKKRVAFAIVMGDSLHQLLQGARSAKNFYRQLHTGKVPPTDSLVTACMGDTLQITIGVPGATHIRVYADSLKNTLLHSGQSWNTALTSSRKFWLTNIDSLFESDVWPFEIRFYKKYSAQFTVQPDSLMLSQSQTAYLMPADTSALHYAYSVNGIWQDAQSIPININFDSVGIYTLCLTAYDHEACTVDTLCVNYKVYDQVTVVDKNSSLAKHWKVYPNPANKRVYVEGLTCDDLAIYNALGRLMPIQAARQGMLWQLDISKIQPGIYILKATSAGKVYQSKLVIKP